MFGKLITQLLGKNYEVDITETCNASDENKRCEDLFEFEDGEWVVINIHESHNLPLPKVDPLEDLLIEHPSMSVYKLRFQNSEDGLERKETVERSLRSLPAKHPVLWRMTACAVGLGHNALLLHVQRPSSHTEHKRLSHSSLHRRNLVKTRFAGAQKRYSHFKQPPQRVYNY